MPSKPLPAGPVGPIEPVSPAGPAKLPPLIHSVPFHVYIVFVSSTMYVSPISNSTVLFLASERFIKYVSTESL